MQAINKGIDERLFNTILETNSQAPFYVLVGIYTKTLGEAWAEMAVVTGAKHGNPLGITHGGLVSTLADAAMGNALRTTGRKGVTVSYDISFLSSAPAGHEMVGRGKVVKAGGKLVFTTSEVYCADQLIAISQGTFYVVGEIDFE